MIVSLHLKRKFQKAKIREIYKEVKNPGIGWYHLYTFDAADPDPELYIACEEESLVLLRIWIGSFKEKELSSEALASIRRILQFFSGQGKDMILRFTYDIEGKGLENEPDTAELVKRHMEQLGSVIREYQKSILAVQGILVGNWGEMHGSRFLSRRSLTELSETMLRAMDYSCYLAVRKPSQWRMIESHGKTKEKLTLFNDGIFGSDTDLGTYDAGKREQELCWQEQSVKYGYHGGEALKEQEKNTCISGRKAYEDLKKMHLSYLNSVYQEELLSSWKEEKMNWPGSKVQVSAYMYLGAHLGYRMVVRDVKLKKQECLQIVVENTGFANLTEEAVCQIEVRGEANQRRQDVENDARRWECQKKAVFEVTLNENDRKKGTKIILHLYRKKDGKQIHFANEGAEDGVLLGQF